MNWLKGALKAVGGFVAGNSGLWGGLFWLAIGAAFMGGAVLWHQVHVDDAIDDARVAGRAEVQQLWDKSVADAKEAQGKQNTDATEAVATEVEVIRTVYRDRIKEVTRYVPNPDTHCPADADFVRMFNAGPAASAAGDSSDQ